MVNDPTDYRLDSMPISSAMHSDPGRAGVKLALQAMTEPEVVCFNLPRTRRAGAAKV
jgi:glyceraldehyde-3-phosphate dehydrogenase (NADP+)